MKLLAVLKGLRFECNRAALWTVTKLGGFYLRRVFARAIVSRVNQNESRAPWVKAETANSSGKPSRSSSCPRKDAGVGTISIRDAKLLEFRVSRTKQTPSEFLIDNFWHLSQRATRLGQRVFSAGAAHVYNALVTAPAVLRSGLQLSRTAKSQHPKSHLPKRAMSNLKLTSVWRPPRRPLTPLIPEEEDS